MTYDHLPSNSEHNVISERSGLKTFGLVWFVFARSAFAMTIGALLVCPIAFGAEAKADSSYPLHARIDQLLAQNLKRGGTWVDAGVVDDAAFLRRLTLDLNGTIPSAEQVRLFLADKAANKRAVMVDHLLANDRFSQIMADTFDTMLIERRADKHVKQSQWRAYLVDAFKKNKPYNILVREILFADGADSETRGRAAFYLNREGEPHLLTRDVGRIFLGRDLQCAQCHNHPNVVDMRQSEYYGIFAFLNRTSLFTNKKKVASLAERAEGEVSYQSVFTKASFTAKPALRGFESLKEPAIEPAKRYKVKPAKGVRGVPVFSRRQQLAIELEKGLSDSFRKNIANRLWAHMLGRGLVHPVDMMHAGNPASHPKLLNMLGGEFAKMNFDTKAMLKEIALSNAYQRPFELPKSVSKTDAKALPIKLATLRGQHTKLNKSVDVSFDLMDSADDDLVTAAKASAGHRKAVAAIGKALAAVQKSALPANKILRATEKKKIARMKLKPALDAAVAAAVQAAKVVNDPAVTQAKTLLEARAAKLAGELNALEVKHKKQLTAAAVVDTKVSDQQAKLTAASTKLFEADRAIDAARSTIKQTLATHKAHADALAIMNRRIQHTETLMVFAKGQGDVINIARRAAADDLSDHGMIRSLKPLTPVQLAWAMMQATGVIDAYRRGLPAELKKKAVAAAAKATAAARKKDKNAKSVLTKPVTTAQINQALNAKIAGSVRTFVSLFAAAAGQPQDTFFSTVDQALFFSNASTLKGWLAPSGGYLIDRLNKQKETAALAKELYLSVLSRQPTDEEVKDVIDFLVGREKDRVAALQEMAWALLTSLEFRLCR
jgi:hypothetical protein